MNMTANEFQYMGGQYRPTFPALLAEFERRNRAAEQAGGWQYDLRYGAHARETFDLRRSATASRGIVIYLHAGFWQSRDKRQFRFLAPALNDAGFDVALLNYPLCPEVSVADITRSVCQAPQAVLQALPPDQRTKPLIVVGHSAGAHLATEIALYQEAGLLRGARIDAIMPISGVFELSPLIDTSLNKNLQLDLASATACSPLHRVVPNLPPAAFVVGGDETPAFLQQSIVMAEAWSGQPGAQGYAAVRGADHFTVLNELDAAGGFLMRTLEDLSERAQRKN